MGFQLRDIHDVRGAMMVDRTGARIGKIDDVFLDRHTGRPAWAAVKTGLFGARHMLVPITAASLNPTADVQVPFARDEVTAAPTIEPDEVLSRDLERSLWTHYGISGYDEWQGADRSRGRGLLDDAEDAAAQQAAPMTVRLRRITILAIAPAARD